MWIIMIQNWYAVNIKHELLKLNYTDAVLFGDRSHTQIKILKSCVFRILNIALLNTYFKINKIPQNQ